MSASQSLDRRQFLASSTALAAFSVGMVWSASAFGPVIQVIVPSACSAASRSILGPSAAISSGTGSAPISRARWAETRSPDASEASPRNRGVSASRYSLM